MTTTKIKIDLAQGIIEAEGTESFVLSIYSDFKEQIALSKTSAGSENTSEKPRTVKKEKTPIPKKSTTKKASKKISTSESTGKPVKDLDLSGEEENQTLSDYYYKHKDKQI